MRATLHASLKAELVPQQTSTKATSCFWSTLPLMSMTLRTLCRSCMGTSGVSNPKLVRCLRKSLVPKHLVNKSATLSVPALCSTKSSFEQILAFIQAIRISTCRLRLGISCPTNNCKAEELSDSSKIWGTSLSLSFHQFLCKHDGKNC